jgi:hypothetical protein
MIDYSVDQFATLHRSDMSKTVPSFVNNLISEMSSSGNISRNYKIYFD